jgi:hypothetical protein
LPTYVTEYASAINGSIALESDVLEHVLDSVAELRVHAQAAGLEVEPAVIERVTTTWEDCDPAVSPTSLVGSDPLKGFEFVDGNPMVRVYRPHVTFPDQRSSSRNGLAESTSYSSAVRAAALWVSEYGVTAKVQTRLVAAWSPRSA